MMPIINPWIFYFIDVLNNLGGLLFVIIMSAIISFIYVMISQENEKEANKWAKRNFKKIMIILSVCTSLYCVVPSEETMYKMLVAQNVTYENVDKAQEEIKETVDYIFKKLGKEDKKDE